MRQVSALIRAGPDGYSSLTDYMQKRAVSHGLPDDCVLGVSPRPNYSPVGAYNWKLPDNHDQFDK